MIEQWHLFRFRVDFGRACAGALAGLHLIALAVFLLTASFASRTLAQEGMSCSGADLRARLAVENPAAREVSRAEAAAIPNSTGIFWKVTKPGVAPSWLLGTMHSPDPRIARIDGAVRDALEASATVLVESTDALDAVKMRAAMQELKDIAYLPKGTNLESLMPQAAIAPLQREAEAHGMPWPVANQMQPWMVAAAIARPMCELRAASTGEPVLDELIARTAQKAGIEVAGLESVSEQFKAVASIAQEFHVNALADLVELGAVSDDVTETTKLLYLKGEIGLVLPLVRVFSPKAYEGKGYAEFQDLLVRKRNAVMVERATPFLEKGNVFMAVGALHLPGKEGIVALLQNAGFAVEHVAR
ncbi:MAG TPA: TraB/GumN family protein [Rhizobiaceae bacterium]|nr:TraB/GumN family protein [Rhizobiaceae bacterium]